ncbi:MAG TPA: patatin-like phospholipase family protein [Spirochaetota bacterium]|nr:patatin-like phospholipase family protein [Spirochaetota bacterium]HOL56155.1 patatin-like phospholipase family protein [Spirochaetota bacterium]HPP05241.1 patatin-like phospholipase family protein [Spirochaetota bacterium]
MFNIEYALVLSGGGAKGSYQIGVWRALRELNIKINAIIGCSVGSLNGALMILDEYEKALELWENISTDKVVDIPSDILKDGIIDVSKLSPKKLLELQKDIIKKGGFSIKPLEDLITKIIDEKKVRESKIDFGLVTYEVNNLKPVEIFIEDIPSGKLKDYLLASATLPGFKITTIDNKKYLDGGLYDNIPINLAKKRGYTNIIAVDISGLGVVRRPSIEGTNTIYIKNSSDTGTILDFSPSVSKRNITMGYLDTLKIFGKIEGIEYFISPKNKDKVTKEILKIIQNNDELKGTLKEYIGRDIIDMERDIRKILPEELKLKKDIIIPLIECAARSFKIEKIKLYEIEELIELIWQRYNTLVNSNKVSTNIEEILNKIKILTRPQKDITLMEYEEILNFVISKFTNIKNNKFYKSTVFKIFPDLLAAKFFCEVLNKYFK